MAMKSTFEWKNIEKNVRKTKDLTPLSHGRTVLGLEGEDRCEDAVARHMSQQSMCDHFAHVVRVQFLLVLLQFRQRSNRPTHLHEYQ